MLEKNLCIILCLCVYSCLSYSNYTQTTIPVGTGWLADKGDVPYQAALKALASSKQQQYFTYCSAVIIAPFKLLTAAHCVVKQKAFAKRARPIEFGPAKVPAYKLEYKYAVAGNLNNVDKYFRSDTEEHGQWRSLEGAILPSDYHFPYHDIAVLSTYIPFSFNEFVAPIPVATRHVEYTGTCLTSSYGRIANPFTNSSLLCAHFDVISTPECSRRHRRNMIGFICTTSKIYDVGKGDSGGPLVCLNTGDPNEGPNGVLVGITSGHRPRAGSFFTRVSGYKNLIYRSDSSYSKSNIKFTLVSVLFSLLYGTFCLF